MTVRQGRRARMNRGGWCRILAGVGAIGLVLHSPLRVRADGEVTGLGEGEVIGVSLIDMEPSISLVASADSRSLANGAPSPVSVLINDPDGFLRITVTPDTTNTTGSWSSVSSTATLDPPSGSGPVVSATATGTSPASDRSPALSTYVSGNGISWTDNNRARLNVSISRASGLLAAGTYRLVITVSVQGVEEVEMGSSFRE